MTRLFDCWFRAVVCLALCASLAACKKSPPAGVDVRAVDLFPADANVAAGIDLAAVLKSPLGPLLRAAAATEPDLSNLVKAASACDVDANVRLVGAGVLDETEDFILVAEGPRVGDWERMVCIERDAQGESSTRLAFEDRGPLRIVPQVGGEKVVILNPDAVAFISPPFVDGVVTRAQDPDARVESELTHAIAAVDTDANAWFAMALDEQLAADFEQEWEWDGADALRRLTFSVRLGESSADVHVALQFADATPAGAFAADVAQALPELKAGLVAAGLSAEFSESLRTDASGAGVHLYAHVAAADVAALVAMAGE